MDKIQRLIVKAQGRYPSKRPHAAFVEVKNGAIEAAVQLWDGVLGSYNPDTDSIVSYHKSEEEAVAWIEQIAKDYKTDMDDIAVIIDDMPDILN